MSDTKKKSAVKKSGSATKAKEAANPEGRVPHTERKGKNLPPVSKQTAGGIGGAVVGGLVGGPIGALVGGVAGAMIGNSSAAGERPIGRTVDGIKEITEEPARKAYASISKAVSPGSKKKKKKPKKKGTDGAAAKKSSADATPIRSKAKK
jgi:predicted lipid-binding transport protein (Tim44 family)